MKNRTNTFTNQRIEALNEEIKREKETIIACINQEYYAMAQNRIKGIEKMNERINDLRNELL